MRGIMADAFLIFIGILLIALLTVRLWYPWFSRVLRQAKTDLDKVKDNEVSLLHKQRIRRIADEVTSAQMANKTPRERAEIYKRRAAQFPSRYRQEK